MSTSKHKQLTHPEYYKFRLWIEALGKEEAQALSAQDLTNKATAALGYKIPLSTVVTSLRDLGWNTGKPRKTAQAKASETEQRLATLEERVAAIELKLKPRTELL